MDKFENARRFAVELHKELAGAGVNVDDPLAVAEAGARHLGLDYIYLELGDPMLKGAHALFDQQSGTILCKNTESPVERAQLIAHEIGHARLHIPSPGCGSEDLDDLSQPEERASVGKQRVQSYGARERRELQANIFARELLLPKLVARCLHVDDRKTSLQIAELTGLPINLVRQQLFDSLLLPDALDPKLAPKSTEIQLDSSQKRAVAHRDFPFLLQAGPGTGKTKTLIQRALSLLGEGVDPASILILTFSNRAAGELTDRLAVNDSDAAQRIWTGTFHSFGLDLLRRHHNRIGLPADPPLYDKGDAVEMLEEILPTLPLKHYRNLWDPVLILCDVLEAISRAKDELAEPARYRELAKQMLANAGEEEKARVEAERCLEIADIYAQYERELDKRGAVDFGDLVMRPALLLENNREVREEVRSRHRHVLVDEYQDVNRASARLLKAVAGAGKRLWVVGDARQSIYRFRGASSANMAKFSEQDYSNVEVGRLEVNYRSTREVVDSFVAAASKMDASEGMEPLVLAAACGGGANRPKVLRYGTLEEEAAGIAAGIRKLEQDGISFRDQAVLCRSNRRVSEIAEVLERCGIPALHLGSLFERSEVRDLLALMSFSANRPGDDLIRICAMPRYGVSLQDVHAAIRYICQDGRAALDILPELSALPGLSKESAAAFKQLARDFAGVSGGSTPWDLLSEYLLDRTDLARRMAGEHSVAGRLRAVAVWQFLNFIRSPGPVSGGSAIRNTLERIRRLALLREDRDLRQVPAVALHMDAVRVMTIHASKGLEFQAVHIPGLTKGRLPRSYSGSRCPLLAGMIEGAEQQPNFAKESHQHEEQCLFFVALSRTRAHLRLYLAQTRSGGKTCTESPFIRWLFPDCADRVDNPETFPLPSDPLLLSVEVALPSDWRLTDKHLTDYKKCPRRFFYTHVLGLERARKTTAFTQTHDCVYELLRWLRRERCRANPLPVAAEKRFEEIWRQRGPTDHAFAAEYWDIALQLIKAAVVSGEGRRFLSSNPVEIDLSGVQVWVEPNEVFELGEDTIILRRVRTGKKRSDEYDRLEYALYLMAAKDKFGAAAEVQALHLTDGTCEDVSLTDRKLANRRKTLQVLATHVASGAFPPNPDEVVCPRCPHFFICGVLPAGPLRFP